MNTFGYRKSRIPAVFSLHNETATGNCPLGDETYAYDGGIRFDEKRYHMSIIMTYTPRTETYITIFSQEKDQTEELKYFAIESLQKDDPPGDIEVVWYTIDD